MRGRLPQGRRGGWGFSSLTHLGCRQCAGGCTVEALTLGGGRGLEKGLLRPEIGGEAVPGRTQLPKPQALRCCADRSGVEVGQRRPVTPRR